MFLLSQAYCASTSLKYAQHELSSHFRDWGFCSTKHVVCLWLCTTVLVFASTKEVELHIAALYFPHYMTFIYLFLLFVQMKVVLFFDFGKWEELEDHWEFRGDIGGL